MAIREIVGFIKVPGTWMQILSSCIYICLLEFGIVWCEFFFLNRPEHASITTLSTYQTLDE